MPDIKYEYHNPGQKAVIPNLTLKQGATGVIASVNLYNKHDFIMGRNRDASLPLDDMHVHNMWGKSGRIPATLAECKDSDLELLSSEFRGEGTAFPIGELMQLRQLELELMKSNPNYRISVDE